MGRGICGAGVNAGGGVKRLLQTEVVRREIADEGRGRDRQSVSDGVGIEVLPESAEVAVRIRMLRWLCLSGGRVGRRSECEASDDWTFSARCYCSCGCGSSR